ncbi:uncharacterized protein LOC129582858 [Paramacrobiotus metropolitanus]|uniref:uncharacterized protein LOC129582858 n=1 Tax=Paramacrobiotus metropolitanus TaxID=2943436 RepID=UPI00244624F1|nr:uncharacterized protein LOC129582858 [Paramacrobiotus metropolitanus]
MTVRRGPLLIPGSCHATLRRHSLTARNTPCPCQSRELFEAFSSPESNGHSSNGVPDVPELALESNSESTVPKPRVGRSESFGGDMDNDVVDSRERAKTSSSILGHEGPSKSQRSVPVGSSLHAPEIRQCGETRESREFGGPV